MNYKHVTRAIIHNADGHIFLAQRAGGRGAGQWALIGGKPEGSETPIETVIREVAEETGLIFKPALFKEEIDETSDPGQLWKVSYFSGPAAGDLDLADENSAGEYFSPEQLATLDIAFGHLRLIQEFLSAQSQ